MKDSIHGLYVVWNISNKCNMGCSYCSADKGTIYQPPTIKEGKKTLQLLLSSEFTSFDFVFHGGEPLLYFPKIKEWVLYLKDKAKETGKNVHFSLQSNLTLLTNESAKFLADNDIDVGTSLDGWENINKKTRFFGNGQGSFPQVIKSLKVLQEYRKEIGVICVVNKYNVSYLSEIVDFFKVLGFYGCSLNRFVPMGRGIRSKNDLVISDRQYLDQVKRVYVKMIGSEEIWPVDPLMSLTRKVLYPYKHLHQCFPCGAGWSHICIGGSGNIYPCDRFCFDPYWNCGTVLKKGLTKILNSKKMSICRSRVNKIKVCQKCKWRIICGGGCAYSAFSAYGDINQRGYECGVIRKLLPWIEKQISKNLFEIAKRIG